MLRQGLDRSYGRITESRFGESPIFQRSGHPFKSFLRDRGGQRTWACRPEGGVGDRGRRRDRDRGEGRRAEYGPDGSDGLQGDGGVGAQGDPGQRGRAGTYRDRCHLLSLERGKGRLRPNDAAAEDRPARGRGGGGPFPGFRGGPVHLGELSPGKRREPHDLSPAAKGRRSYFGEGPDFLSPTLDTGG